MKKRQFLLISLTSLLCITLFTVCFTSITRADGDEQAPDINGVTFIDPASITGVSCDEDFTYYCQFYGYSASADSFRDALYNENCPFNLIYNNGQDTFTGSLWDIRQVTGNIDSEIVTVNSLGISQWEDLATTTVNLTILGKTTTMQATGHVAFYAELSASPLVIQVDEADYGFWYYDRHGKLQYKYDLDDVLFYFKLNDGAEYEGSASYFNNSLGWKVVVLDDQENHPFEPGNEYEVPFHVEGIPGAISVSLSESPIKNITCNKPLHIVSGTYCHNDTLGGSYFYVYEIENALYYSDIILTVTFIDNTTFEGTYREFVESSDFDIAFYDFQYTDHWQPDNTYQAGIFCTCAAGTMDIVIDSNPLKSITPYGDLHITENTFGHVEAGNYLYSVEEALYASSLSFTIEYNNSTPTKTLTYKQMLSQFDDPFTFIDTQDQEEWLAGGTYVVTVDYFGCQAKLNVVIDPSEISEFTVNSDSDVIGPANYLADCMAARHEAVNMILWIPDSLISGYSSKIFNEAIQEKEDVSQYNRGDYLWYHLTGSGYKCVLTDLSTYENGLHKIKLTYSFNYLTTAEEEEAVISKIDEVISSFGFTSETTDADKVKAVYEWLSDGARYDLTLKENGNKRTSAYDAIINKKAVCQGYSNASYIFLRRLGIMNRIIFGTVVYDGSTIPHAWNLVKLGDSWYNYCVTTEIHMKDYGDTLTYRYLLKADNDTYFSIFTRGKDSRNFDYSSSSFRATHPVTNSYVYPGKVKNLSVSPKSAVTMQLSWSEYSGANGYEIWCSVDGGTYTKVKTCAKNQFSTSHTGLSAGHLYSYKIIAINSAGTTVAISDIKSACALATPTITEIVPLSDGISLAWSKASGADRYNIYRSNSANGTYSYITSVQGVESFVDNSVENGKTYYYKVRAYKKIDGIVYYGGYSGEAMKQFIKMSSPSASPKSGVTVSLSWSKIGNAYSYKILHSTDGVSYTVVKTTGSSQTSTSHTGLTAGTLHYYQIQVYDDSSTLIAVSGIAKTVTLATPELYGPALEATGIRLSWSKASGADRYNIYRSTSQNGTYEYITSVQKVETYLDTDVVSGTTYYYKIRPYKKVDGSTYYGGYSNAMGKTFKKLTGFTVSPKSGVTMQLSWNSVDGAYAYEVYSAGYGSETFTLVKTTGKSQTSCSHTGLTAGQLYRYRILVKDTAGNVIACSEEKKAVALATPSITSAVMDSGKVTLTWSKASGADRYNIYRSTTPNGTYEYIESVQHVEQYVDTSVSDGQVYYYRVRAYKRVDGVVYYGGYSSYRQSTTS